MSEEQQMQKYIGVKLIHAIPMTRAAYNVLRGWDLPEDEEGSDKGFLVEYTDGGQPNHKDYAGYISWSPDEVFQNAYKEVEGLNFGLAIEVMKKGFKAARKGWNGAGMYAVLMNGYPDGVPANKETAEIHGIGVGEPVKIRPYLVLKTAQNDIATWSPSTSDALAEDWMVVD